MRVLFLHKNAALEVKNRVQFAWAKIHVFYCEYVYRLLYVREWFVGDFVCVGV